MGHLNSLNGQPPAIMKGHQRPCFSVLVGTEFRSHIPAIWKPISDILVGSLFVVLKTWVHFNLSRGWKVGPTDMVSILNSHCYRHKFSFVHIFQTSLRGKFMTEKGYRLLLCISMATSPIPASNSSSRYVNSRNPYMVWNSHPEHGLTSSLLLSSPKGGVRGILIILYLQRFPSRKDWSSDSLCRWHYFFWRWSGRNQ